LGWQYNCHPNEDFNKSLNMHLTINGQSRQIADSATVAELLDELKLSGNPVAVEVNLELVPKQRHAEHRLAEGDCLEIVTLVGGG
jgi:sulfur carrier protein